MKTQVPAGSSESAPPQAAATVPARRPSTWLRRFCRAMVWSAVFLAIMTVAGWLAREPITAKMEAMLIRDLHEQGVYPQYTKRSWLPWRGFHCENVVLHRDGRGNAPVVELSDVRVTFPWTEIWRSGGVVSRWRTHDARLTLHDANGAIAFDHVSFDIRQRGQQLDFAKLELRHNPVLWGAKGRVMLGSFAAEPDGKFTVDLSVVRAVLERTDFNPRKGPFEIRGTFSMDFRPTDPTWRASLTGTGKGVEWSGVPLRDATVQADLSENGLRLSSNLQFTNGSAKIAASRADWDHSPLLITGEFADGGGRSDAIAGRYDHENGAFVIATLSGPVNLFRFAQNFPTFIPPVSTGIRIRTFPDILVKDATWTFGGPATVWSLGVLQLRTPADVTIAIGGQSLSIDQLKGEASFKDKVWRFRATTGPIAWGDLAARAAGVDGGITASDVKLKSKLSLAKGSVDLTVSSGSAKPGSWLFTGSLADSAGSEDRIGGRFEGRSQTTIVDELSGKANLEEFASNFRAAAALLPSGLQIRTFPEIAVKGFSYQAGKKSDKWSVDSLQLRSAADITVAAQGRPLTINQLTGSAGFDGKAWRLSKVAGQALGGRFAVDGLYGDGLLRQSDLTVENIRIEQLSLWTNAAPASLGDAILSLNYRGALGFDPRQLTGAGGVQMENAPLVKVPLLDQTYAFFSAVLPGVNRTGAGRLKSAFTVKDGVFKVTQFSADSNALAVSATGTLDLVHREISARAHGNLRGAAGLATSPVGWALEMKVSGPLDQVRVQPVGPVGEVGKSLSTATKVTGDVLKSGLTMPFKVLDWFKSDSKR